MRIKTDGMNIQPFYRTLYFHFFFCFRFKFFYSFYMPVFLQNECAIKHKSFSNSIHIIFCHLVFFLNVCLCHLSWVPLEIFIKYALEICIDTILLDNLHSVIGWHSLEITSLRQKKTTSIEMEATIIAFIQCRSDLVFVFW